MGKAHPNPRPSRLLSDFIKINSSLRKWTSALKAYCSTCLADFKVPKLIHLVSAIPKNAMGKVRRHDLTALFS